MLAVSVSYMFDWQSATLSYNIHTPIGMLEADIRDITPRDVLIGDVVVAPWIMSCIFFIIMLFVGNWCRTWRSMA